MRNASKRLFPLKVVITSPDFEVWSSHRVPNSKSVHSITPTACKLAALQPKRTGRGTVIFMLQLHTNFSSDFQAQIEFMRKIPAQNLQLSLSGSSYKFGSGKTTVISPHFQGRCSNGVSNS